ncbi:phosphatase PAP2 family protein [Paucisalibacillus sp. EB02]|uniref:phosphatase PAP2 family protein n=1 Tax=Paucisalibacillus sp. EB02 TaxID=1347087 RepID=UPI0004B5306D|nr:phosphatase PAP2 family protein [Paucisalibacillus sp. EB02]
MSQVTYKRLCIIAFLFSLCCVLLIQQDVIKRIDFLFNQWSYSFSNPMTDVFWRMFTILGDTETLAISSILMIAFLLWKKKIQEIILYILMMSSGIIITFCLKIIIQKDRPGDVEYIDFWGFGRDIISFSFPSGHAVKSLLLFGFIIWLIRKSYPKNQYTITLTILLLIGIVLCGFGQIFLHEHYLSDVIGGYLVGITIHSFSLWMYYWWKDRRKQSTLPYRIAK